MTTNNESKDIEIQFLYFDGCPNAAQTRENLGIRAHSTHSAERLAAHPALSIW